ncbi:Short-chain dehydrogenase/reductase tropE [Fusarium culmorum]|uniref:Short-chain dehydrogenase/reductase tropE n=1 Tax=Fusarium culmorum TaxID=5516 RepID=A0A2T4GVB2_FUSCU|nr:Short-chain dehydrogenase/reductase tropE [Fusarium culmorum]
MSKYKKFVLITGANQGVGYETAKNLLLSSVDYHVIIGSRDEAKGEVAASELRSLENIKGTVSSIQLDVTDDASVDVAARNLTSEWGRLDILVNNAGIISMASPPTREAFRTVLETNLIGALSVTEAFLPLLRKAEHLPPRLIFVTSSTGSITHAANPDSPYYNPYATEYRTSKAGLNMLMAMYYARLKPDGFLVFSVDPGLCATNFTHDAESLRQRGAAEPSDGGEQVACVVKGEKDKDVGNVIGAHGVVPCTPGVIKAKIDEAWGIYDGIDVVVNNAGFILSGPFEEQSQEDMDRSFQVNLHGPLNITRAILPHFKERKSGTLLYVSSQAAWHSDPGASSYCASKFALEGAVECLAKELAIIAPTLKVLIVEPGYCRTPVFDKVQYVTGSVPDYSQFNEAVRGGVATLSATSPGNPDMAVAQMIELVKGTGFAEGKTMPLRVPLGSDCWERIKAKCEETLEICNEWEGAARSIDYKTEA